LRGVSISTTNRLDSLAFTESLKYVRVRYKEEAYLSETNNLIALSLLGIDFMQDQLIGNIREYIRVIENGRAYELFITDFLYEGTYPYVMYFESRLIVSVPENGEFHYLYCFEVPGRTQNASGGLIIADVNFDGRNDILIKQGHFGNQGFVLYTCFFFFFFFYVLNRSFSSIRNPSLDTTNSRILTSWRNHAASHSWAMYSYINGVFTETERLTWEPEAWGQGDGINADIHAVRFITERFINGDVSVNTYDFLTYDYSFDEWMNMFYEENSFWASALTNGWVSFSHVRVSDNMRAGSVDYQIMKIIND
jgi:preprotein translocase subunit SecE